MFVFLCVVAVQLLVMTGVLAGALLVTGEEITGATLPKCLLVSVVAFAVSWVPVFGTLSSIIWFAALIGLFKKSIVEALAVAFTCCVIGLGLEMATSSFLR